MTDFRIPPPFSPYIPSVGNHVTINITGVLKLLDAKNQEITELKEEIKRLKEMEHAD